MTDWNELKKLSASKNMMFLELPGKQLEVVLTDVSDKVFVFDNNNGDRREVLTTYSDGTGVLPLGLVKFMALQYGYNLVKKESKNVGPTKVVKPVAEKRGRKAKK